jgi:hypothetical protein
MLLLATLAATTVPDAFAAVTPDEAKLLGTTLTPFGAEKSGNADGSIPAYTGGIVARGNLPALEPAGNGFHYPDPFAHEKPIASITAQNMAQFGDALPPSAKALLTKLSGYRMDLYPAHRTASYPDWVIRNTLRNAPTAHLVGDKPGDGVEGAYGGIPFPIPKNGYEVLWNHYLHFRPAYYYNRFQAALRDSSGAMTDLGSIDGTLLDLYYDPSKTALAGDYQQKSFSTQYSPASLAGQLFLSSYPINYSVRDQTTWFYRPGVRRVRLAPEYTYDTPTAAFGGVVSYDEISLLAGRLDKFDMKLVGKKEIIVPYNCYRLDAPTPLSTLSGPTYFNPDFVRWEKHRVWVIEATLRPGERHTFNRKTFYADEDSWDLLVGEDYDDSGTIARITYSFTYPLYPDANTSTLAEYYAGYNVNRGNYYLTSFHVGPNDVIVTSKDLPDLAPYVPQAMGGRGVR